MASKLQAAKVYIEVAFWLNLVAGVIGLVVQMLTGYPGVLISPDILFIGNVVVAVLNFVVTGILRRGSPEPTPPKST